MIKKLVLRNWKSHGSSCFEFSKGTNLLIGIMGSGKTSAMDALSFALFGSFPALQHRRVKLGDIILRGAEGAEVELEFSFDGGEYAVKRSISADGESEAELRKNGAMLQTQPERVSEEVARVLGVNYELFSRAIYSEQNRIDYLLNLGKGERKKQIDELLEIDKFENARASASALANRLKEMRDDKKKVLAAAGAEKLAQEIKEAEKELANFEKGIEKAEAELASLEASLKEKRLLFGNAEKVRKEFAELRERKAAVEYALDVLCSEIKEMQGALAERNEKELKSAHAELVENAKMKKEGRRKAEAELLAGTEERAKLSRKVEELQASATEKSGIEKELSKILAGRSIGQVEKEAKEAEDASAELASIARSFGERIKEAEAGIAELERARAKCPVCESALSDGKREKLLKERRGRLFLLKEEVEKARRDAERKREELALRRRENEEAQKLGAKLGEHRFAEVKLLGEFEGKLALAEKKASKAMGEKEKLASELEGIERELKGVEALVAKFSELVKKRGKKEKLENELSDASKKLSALSFDERAHEKAREEVLSVEKLHSARSAGLAKDGEMAGEKRKMLKLLKSKLSETERAAREIEGLGKAVENILKFQNCVLETQKVVRESAMGAINSAMGEVWGTLYPYADFNGIRLRAEEDGYELELLGGDWKSADGIASGGERMSACLALRIALSAILAPRLSWLVLDEPTHNLDEEAVRALGSALREYIPKIVEQAFVITHDENLRDAAGGRYYRLERNKNKGEATRVEVVE